MLYSPPPPPQQGLLRHRYRPRRGEYLQCRACGKRIKRMAQHQLFCSRRCRQRFNYGKAVAQGRFNPFLARDTGRPTHPPCKPLNGHSFRGDKPRAFPRLNAAPEAVIEAEIIAGGNWAPVVSPDGVRCEVAETLPRIDPTVGCGRSAATRTKANELIAAIPADLSIPDFLKRELDQRAASSIFSPRHSRRPVRFRVSPCASRTPAAAAATSRGSGCRSAHISRSCIAHAANNIEAGYRAPHMSFSLRQSTNLVGQLRFGAADLTRCRLAVANSYDRRHQASDLRANAASRPGPRCRPQLTHTSKNRGAASRPARDRCARDQTFSASPALGASDVQTQAAPGDDSNGYA